MTESIEHRVGAIVSALSGVEHENITPATRLEALDFDSLVLLELSLKLRKNFGIEEAGEELDLIETVDELVQFVKQRRAC